LAATLREYAYYRRGAQRAGYVLLVVEVRGSAREGGAIEALHARSTHGVPLSVMRALHERWEDDTQSRAVARLRPLGLGHELVEPLPLEQASPSQPPLPSLPPPPMHPPTQSLQQWLSAHHCIHHSRSRKSSHLRMAASGEAAAFVYVPPAQRAAFHAVFWAERGPRFLAELVDEQQLRMFVDIDLHGAPRLVGAWLLWLCRALQRVLDGHGLGPQRIVATASDPHAEDVSAEAGAASAREEVGGGVKGGAHLHAHGAVVDVRTALALRSALLAVLAGEPFTEDRGRPEAGIDWTAAIDAAVYRGGLRMVGSLKVKNGRVVGNGRQHSVIMVVEPSGEPLPQQELRAFASDGRRVLAACSIRADA